MGHADWMGLNVWGLEVPNKLLIQSVLCNHSNLESLQDSRKLRFGLEFTRYVQMRAGHPDSKVNEALECEADLLKSQGIAFAANILRVFKKQN